MNFNWKQIIILTILTILIFIGGIVTALISGFAFGYTKTNDMRSLLEYNEAAIPSRILDKKGRLISELVGDEKREIIYFHELPIEIVTALMSREDPKFFYHAGFSLKSTLRAILFLGKRGGGSTISQQTAGVKFCDRREMSIKRKLNELWFSFNLERDLSKEEIIQLYLNEVYFGHGAYGIEAASQFFFGHSARKLTLAESAIIVTPISSPYWYSLLKFPDKARSRQEFTLDRMTELGYIEKGVKEIALKEFWNNFDKTRSPDETYQQITGTQNKAPWFTDYIREELQNILSGTANIYKDGYIIETTLDLDLQEKAENAVKYGLDRVEKVQSTTPKNENNSFINKYIPIIDMLCLTNNISGINNYKARRERKIRNQYIEEKASMIAALALIIGNDNLQDVAKKTKQIKVEQNQENEVQSAMITIENNTGRILTMIGGREYDKQYTQAILNRATMGAISPGSCIKPLYYSAGISSRKITPATVFNDSPIMFHEKGKDPWIPNNYLDVFEGSVRVRYALKRSMNIPSAQVFNTIGYDLAIDRIATLLGMPEEKNNRIIFPHNMPVMVLGQIQVSPIKMARAFATFANKGVSTEPHGIMAIKDRKGNPLGEYGNIGLKLEEDIISRREEYRVLTPEEAYIMVSMLQSTVQSGTLRYVSHYVDKNDFDGMPMGGKTGTTQNWEDAWTVGFSPYMTTAVWFGYDTGNQSLGLGLTGAGLGGRAWTHFMSNAHKNLPIKKFYKPDNGLIERTICKKTGKMATSSCKKTLKEYFLIGTEPKSHCSHCATEPLFTADMENKIKQFILLENKDKSINNNSTISLPSLSEILGNTEAQNNENSVVIPNLSKEGSIFSN